MQNVTLANTYKHVFTVKHLQDSPAERATQKEEMLDYITFFKIRLTS